MPNDKVLEIGPGAFPHPRADVYLDKYFDNGEELNLQFGNTKRKEKLKNLIYYGGGSFPFQDKEFDYVICSHVIEHINIEELPLFLSELARVAPKGYLEVPSFFYECICNAHVHKWLIGNDGKTLRFYAKNQLPKIELLDTFRQIFYNCDEDMIQLFPRYREVFFIGFEWENSIDFEIVDSIDSLFGESEKNFFNKNIKTSYFFRKENSCIVYENGKLYITPPTKVLIQMNINKLKQIFKRYIFHK